MSREIKCKAWDKVNKKWIGERHLEYLCVSADVVVLVKYKPDDNGGYSPESCRQLTNPEVDNLSIVQYTGLKDKNGKDAYFKDIAKIVNTDGMVMVKTIYWDNDIGCVCFGGMPFINIMESGYSQPSGEFEIIGNIYENPELIKS